ncbi:putative BPI/LBP family protein At1g04970 isoform X1 [Herrania umbratica]|uniref:BPI/LBP family protein At1g04970 isoform X1 n=1 Tax=Herrania umbratica TaxID=108875 RepID=A0A6J0ZHV1_9ROSI|nr:putative BPI/LBP family protein At1g04970 isoform X1 [Herrania umbratica]
MAHLTFLFFLISSLFLSSQANLHLQPLRNQEESFTSILVSQQGLDFIKDLLINKAISSIIPLQLPATIEKSARIPFLGNVHMVISNVTIYKIDVLSSYVKPGNTGIAIVASGTTCNLTMNWHYSYSSWLLPIEISDGGRASVQVEGMEVGLTLGLENHEGTLKLSLMDCGCYVKEITIKLDGGASWLYQGTKKKRLMVLILLSSSNFFHEKIINFPLPCHFGMINAFEEQIGSAVENAITNKLKYGILKLDSFLRSLPKEIPVDDNASLNVSFVENPLLSSSFIEFDINGLFTAKEKVQIPKHYRQTWQPSVFCSDQSKMLGISLDEAVFNSASALYYDAEFMEWIVDKVPDQALLNTAGWRFIIPQLYKKYPNDDMNLNISLSSPPLIRISGHNIGATVYADVIIDVVEAGQVIPVACISLEIHGSGSVKIVGNNLGGSVKLDDLVMSLKWSQIGNLRMYLIQPVMWTLVQTVVIPYANSYLGKGFPLPIIHGFTLLNAEITLSSSKVTVCSDVAYSESHNLNQLGIYFE